MHIEKTSNTVSLCGGCWSNRWSLTFWSRAMASCGWTEAYRFEDGLYFSIHFWGWAISFQTRLPPKSSGYFRSYWKINLNWLHYDRNRGGAFAHFKWAQRLARWKKEREAARRLWKLQHRKCWWEASRGQWWEFDTNEQRSYYKFLRAIYKLPASEAWSRAKEQFSE